MNRKRLILIAACLCLPTLVAWASARREASPRRDDPRHAHADPSAHGGAQSVRPRSGGAGARQPTLMLP